MPVGDTIFQRLRAATDAELTALASRLKVPKTGDRELDIVALSKEYRSAAGNSFANLFRGDHDLPYRDILLDCVDTARQTAGWRAINLNAQYSEERLEDFISKALVFACTVGSKAPDPEKERAAAQAEREANGEAPPTPSSDYRTATSLGLSAVGGVIGWTSIFAVVPAMVVMIAISPSTQKVLEVTMTLLQIRHRLENEKTLRQQTKEAA